MQSDQSPGLEALMEQLEKETMKLTKMLYAGFDQGEEFRECELRIKRIQVEIISRKGNSINLPKPFPIHGMIF